MRRFEIHWRRAMMIQSCFPAGHANAPFVTGLQSRKTKLWYWGNQVIAVQH